MEKTQEQRVSELEKRVDALALTLRVGTVTTVNEIDGTARISWDSGVRSGSLKILENGTGWMPRVGQRVVSLHKPEEDGAGYILGAV